MLRKLMCPGSWNFTWQKVKGFLHPCNLVDHLFAIAVLAVLIPLRFYWKRVKDADSQNQATTKGPLTVSLIYDSIRISTGRVDAAYDYIVKLDQSLNSTPKSRSTVWLLPGNATHPNASDAWKLKNVLKRVREIMGTDSQVVHIHYTVGAYKRGLAIYCVPLFIRFHKSRPRVVITYHQFTEHKPNSLLFRSLFLLLCLSADGYIFLRNDHIRSFAWGETFLNKKFTFIPSPSNLEFDKGKMDSIHSKFPPHATVHLSHFGTIRQGKGLETLVMAFSAVHERYSDVKLILAGAIDEAYRQKLMRKTPHDLTGSIVFTGQLSPDDLYDTLSGTIVVLPFPDGATTYRSSLMAALDMGVPIVTTWSKDTPEIFEDGKNIFLAQCGSWEDLAAVIDRVMSQQASYRHRVGMEGSRLYSSSFSWSKCLGRHLAFYRKILS